MYIFYDGTAIQGKAFSLPHRTRTGIISPNTAIPALRHRYRIIPCERAEVATRDEEGCDVRDTGEEVIFVERVPKKDKDGNIKRDEDGNILYRDKEYKYPELIATEKYYVPTADDQMSDELKQEVLDYMDLLESLGISGLPESWEVTIQQAEDSGISSENSLKLYIIWKEKLQPYEDLIRQWLAEQESL